MTLGKLIGLVVFLISLYILWRIKEILLLIFAAVVLANALNILVKRFQNLGLKRIYAVFLSVTLSLALLIIFLWLVVPPFIAQFQQLAVKVPEAIERITAWLNSVQERLALPEYFPEQNLIDRLLEQIEPIIAGGWAFLGGGWNFFSSSFGILLKVLLVLILTLMFLAEPQPYRQAFIRMFPSFYRSRVDEVLLLCSQDLQGWLVGILFNMTVITILSFTGLLILGIPLALAQALLAGILTFIPNIGPAISVTLPIAISLLEEPWKAIAVLIYYIVVQQLESNLLTPLVMAQQVSLLPAFTLCAQVFFATFFGFLGLLLALPLTVIGQVWIREVLIKDILDQWQPQGQSNSEQNSTITMEQPVPAVPEITVEQSETPFREKKTK